jgi:hypothetical protein
MERMMESKSENKDATPKLLVNRPISLAHQQGQAILKEIFSEPSIEKIRIYYECFVDENTH